LQPSLSKNGPGFDLAAFGPFALLVIALRASLRALAPGLLPLPKSPPLI